MHPTKSDLLSVLFSFYFPAFYRFSLPEPMLPITLFTPVSLPTGDVEWLLHFYIFLINYNFQIRKSKISKDKVDWRGYEVCVLTKLKHLDEVFAKYY